MRRSLAIRGASPGRRSRSAWSSRPAMPGDELVGLPELVVEGLREADARALLDSVLTGPLDAAGPRPDRGRGRWQPAGAGGAAPRGDAGGAGGWVRPSATRCRCRGGSRRASGGGWSRFRPDSLRLLQLAAADPVGDPVLVWRAAERLGIAAGAATPTAEARPAWSSALGCGSGIRWCGRRSTGRHRCRSAESAPRPGRGHRPARLDPDRRAWHLGRRPRRAR